MWVLAQMRSMVEAQALENIERRLGQLGGGQVIINGDDTYDQPLQPEQLAEQLGQTVRHTYKVFLDFGESDEEFYARYPEARGRRREGIILSFGTGADKFVRIPQPE